MGCWIYCWRFIEFLLNVNYNVFALSMAGYPEVCQIPHILINYETPQKPPFCRTALVIEMEKVSWPFLISAGRKEKSFAIYLDIILSAPLTLEGFLDISTETINFLKKINELLWSRYLAPNLRFRPKTEMIYFLKIVFLEFVFIHQHGLPFWKHYKISLKGYWWIHCRDN